MATVQEQLFAELRPDVLEAMRAIAERDHVPVATLVQEALTEFLRKHETVPARAHVMAAYQASHEKYAPLYKKLAE